MRLLLLLVICSVGGAAWSSEVGSGGTNTSAASNAQTCDAKLLGADAKAACTSTQTHYKCVTAVRAALAKAGCHVPLGGPDSYSILSKYWHCEHTPPAKAPDGAVIMYQRGKSRHYEVKYHNCYYSDFHHPECLPATQYHNGPFKEIGWCVP
jgi:hypothetical protein